jgi:hypothetical protein
MPNLITFGATEYMDGALTFPVLTELLFRGRPMRDQQRKPSHGRNPSPDETEFGPNDWHRRKDSKVYTLSLSKFPLLIMDRLWKL